MEGELVGDHLSCPMCGCTVMTLDRTHTFVTDLNRYWEDSEWAGGSFDLHDGCPCHEVALRFLTNKYDSATMT